MASKATNAAAVESLADAYSDTLPQNRTGKKQGRNGIVHTIRHVLGYFVSENVKGFNVLLAVLYAYTVLRNIRGTATVKGNETTQRDPRESYSQVRMKGKGYGRAVDENTLLDIVQDAFCEYHYSQRGRDGGKPENLDTRAAARRALAKWWKKERRNSRITRDQKAIDRFCRSIETSVVDDLELVSDKETTQFQTLLSGLSAGKKKKEIAKELGVSGAYISKLLKRIRQGRIASRINPDAGEYTGKHKLFAFRPDHTTNCPFKAGYFNAERGLWCITTAVDLPAVNGPTPHANESAAFVPVDMPKDDDNAAKRQVDPCNWQAAKVGLPYLPMVPCDCRPTQARFDPARPWYVCHDVNGTERQIEPSSEQPAYVHRQLAARADNLAGLYLDGAGI